MWSRHRGVADNDDRDSLGSTAQHARSPRLSIGPIPNEERSSLRPRMLRNQGEVLVRRFFRLVHFEKVHALFQKRALKIRTFAMKTVSLQRCRSATVMLGTVAVIILASVFGASAQAGVVFWNKLGSDE